jgi:hypothetical protein
MSNTAIRAQQPSGKTQAPGASSEHDFDFLVGSWTVQHLRLKHRLAHSSEWETFSGTCTTWSVLDGRHPHQLDPPVVGAFRNGSGTFFAKDTFNGQPIVVRYIWSDITANSAKWQQAFSDDSGKSWETNWIMEFHRRVAATQR